MAKGRLLSRTLGSSRKFTAIASSPGIGEFAQLLFTLLIPHTDDFGRMDGDAFTVKHAVFPTSPRSIEDFDAALTAMAAAGLILLYDGDGRTCLQVVDFEKHQGNLHKRTKTLFPDPPEIPGNSGKFREIPESPGNSGKLREIPGSRARAESNRTESNRTESNRTEPNRTEPKAPPARGVVSTNVRDLGAVWDRWGEIAAQHGAKQPLVAGPGNFEHLRVLADSYGEAELDRAMVAWWASPFTGGRALGLFRSQVGEVLEHLARNDGSTYRSPRRPVEVAKAAEPSLADQIAAQSERLAKRFGVTA